MRARRANVLVVAGATVGISAHSVGAVLALALLNPAVAALNVAGACAWALIAERAVGLIERDERSLGRLGLPPVE